MAIHETTSKQAAYPHTHDEICMRTFREKMADCMYCFQRRSAGSLQLSRFREKPTNSLTSVAC